MVLYQIVPGKNIISLNASVQQNTKSSFARIKVHFTNSKEDAENILYFDSSSYKVLNTTVQFCSWYNEVSDSIDITCYTTSVDKINIIYYSENFKSVDYNFEIQELKDDVDCNSKMYIDSLDQFEKKMNKKFKTNKEKIHELVKTELSYKLHASNEDIFPLSEITYDHTEINSMIDVLLSDKLTMGNNVERFEKEFAHFIGSNYAIMVNSGSSANLLAMAVLSNFKFENGFVKGDKVIVPTVCWSTSVWPIIQMGLEPVFVDIDIKTLNADVDKIEELLENDNKIRGMVVVHILGNTLNMNKLMQLKNKYKLILMEDTCESLGSKYNNKNLGTFGECGTYSFYFSHHITTIEGGMVATDNFHTYELLKCLRSHGWSRGITSHNNNSLDNRFCFINVGYNLRPMEIQAAMGSVQLKKLSKFQETRKSNYERIMYSLKEKNSDILTSFTKEPCSLPAWFALPFIINSKYEKEDYLKYLEKNNISTRPIVTGNFARQPVFKDLNMNVDPVIFVNAELIHNQGFFIGLPSNLMSDSKIEKLVNILISY